MSRSTDSRATQHASRDGGFSLLEVIVALGLMLIVMTAVLPQLIVGIRAGARASEVTQAKGVVQGQLEKMRSLPFHVAPLAGNFIDVLDRYYPNLTVPSTTPAGSCMDGSGKHVQPLVDWSGYVKPDSTARCSYEPAAGTAFYRTVHDVPGTAGHLAATVVTNAQFLAQAPALDSSQPTVMTPQAVTPATGYSSITVGKDAPASTQIGVTVTVLYRDHGTLHPVTTYTQIANNNRSPVRMQAKVNATALEIGSITADGTTLSLTGGLVNINGALSRTSTVNANLAGTSAAMSDGVQVTGAAGTVSVPTTATSASAITQAGGDLTSTCAYACWDQTRLGQYTATANAGLPNAGTSTTPLQASVSQLDANAGFKFTNTSSSTQYRSGPKFQSPLVRLASAASSNSATGTPGCSVDGGSYVTGGGYIHTTAATDTTGPSQVDSCAAASNSTIVLFPTSFAPQGVVRIRLDKAMARCTLAGVAHTPSVAYDYAGSVEYWNGSAFVNAGTIQKGITTDPLQALLASNPDVGDGHKLQDYIASWSGLVDTTATIPQKSAVGIAEVSLPGVIKIVTTPVRVTTPVTDPPVPDPTSAISLTVGAVDCAAQDAR